MPDFYYIKTLLKDGQHKEVYLRYNIKMFDEICKEEIYELWYLKKITSLQA